MPLLIDRRQFWKRAAGVAALPAFVRFAQADDRPTARWALLSDTHIAADPNDTYRGFSPHTNLKTVLEQVKAGKFETMVVNGDLARLQGKPEDYVSFTNHLELLGDDVPLVITMGNHDHRENARKAIAPIEGDVQPVEKKLVTVLDSGPVTFVMLDSLLATNVVPGQLGKSQRAWLASYLGTQTKPHVVFVHHNPDSENDGGLVDADKLLNLLQSHTAVKALFYGHTHAWRHETVGGLHLVNIPAVGFNFVDSEPVGWTEATFNATAATLKLHALAGNREHDGETLQLQWR